MRERTEAGGLRNGGQYARALTCSRFGEKERKPQELESGEASGRTAVDPSISRTCSHTDARGRPGLLRRAELSERRSGALGGKAVLPGWRAAEQVLSWEEAARTQRGRTLSQRPALLWGLIRHQLWSRPRILASSWGVKPTSPSDLVSPGWEGSGRAASQAQTCAAALLHAALAASQGHTA